MLKEGADGVVRRAVRAAVPSAERHDEPAQGALVAAAVLQARERAVRGEFADQGGGELAVHGDRQVVGVQRQVDAGAQGAEVAGDLHGVGAGVERGGGHQGVGARRPRGLGVDEDAGCGHVDDTGEHGDAARDGLDDRLQDQGPLPVGEEGDLAAGAEGEQSVHSTAHEVLDVPDE
jgi:hypothetical protein